MNKALEKLITFINQYIYCSLIMLMRSQGFLSLIVVSLLVLMLAFSSFFILNERQTAIILQFGKMKKTVSTAGLHFKIPLIDDIEFFDNRLLDFDALPSEVIASDKKRLVVDAFAKYKITDPLVVYQSARSVFGVEQRLSSILDSSMRQVIGEVTIFDLLTTKRPEIMERIQKIANTQAQNFGVSITDVRITKADLPAENSDAIFNRMRTEREKEAREIRAEGDSEAKKIIAKGDRTNAEIIAAAKRDAEIIKGKADSQAIKTYSSVYNKDVDFFEFYRTMDAYHTSLQNKKIILTPDGNDFLKHIKKR